MGELSVLESEVRALQNGDAELKGMSVYAFDSCEMSSKVITEKRTPIVLYNFDVSTMDGELHRIASPFLHLHGGV